MIFAIEKVKFREGGGELTFSGGRLVGVSVAIVLPVENGCMICLERKNDPLDSTSKNFKVTIITIFEITIGRHVS